MCDFHYPYYPDGKRVEYIGNVDDVKVVERGCYSVGHSGSYTFYFDGQKEYKSEDSLPDGLVWKNTMLNHP